MELTYKILNNGTKLEAQTEALRVLNLFPETKEIIKNSSTSEKAIENLSKYRTKSQITQECIMCLFVSLLEGELLIDIIADETDEELMEQRKQDEKINEAITIIKKYAPKNYSCAGMNYEYAIINEILLFDESQEFTSACIKVLNNCKLMGDEQAASDFVQNIFSK